MPRRNQAKERAEREAAVIAAAQAEKISLATKLTRIADDAADKLHQVVLDGVADAAYVGALRLSLQAAGALVERHKTEGTTEIRVTYASDAPGTLPPTAGDV